MMRRSTLPLCATLLHAGVALAADPWAKTTSVTGEDALLPAESAFQLLGATRDAQAVTLEWLIAPGYYLYRQRFGFEPQPATAKLGAAELPTGEKKHDEHFGDVEVYRASLSVRLPLLPGAAVPARLRVRFQGCADAGVCYPPVTRVVELAAPAP